MSSSIFGLAQVMIDRTAASSAFSGCSRVDRKSSTFFALVMMRWFLLLLFETNMEVFFVGKEGWE